MKPFEIIISEEIHEACPQFVGCAVMAEMVNSQFCKELWDEIGHETEKFRERHTTESIKQIRRPQPLQTLERTAREEDYPRQGPLPD